MPIESMNLSLVFCKFSQEPSQRLRTVLQGMVLFYRVQYKVEDSFGVVAAIDDYELFESMRIMDIPDWSWCS